jgi:hypothetical protein
MNPVCSSCSPISASAVQGMQKAEARLEKAADKIAQLPNAVDGGAAGVPGAGGDTVDLSAQMVALLGARDNFMANVEAFKTGDALQRTLLNMVG